MGQRHQLFIIARVNGRYRTLAAVHHQWLYGSTALRRCFGTLKLLQHPGSQPLVQQELISAAKRDDDMWEESHEFGDKFVPFPYLMTCLMLGASFGPEDGYISSVQIEPFGMAYNEGDNNNGELTDIIFVHTDRAGGMLIPERVPGITIFDVTNTKDVRYCFVDFYGMESEREVQLMAPLSARTYLEAYYELSEPKAKHDLLPLVESFSMWRLISTAVLEDTWPGEGWEESKDERDLEATSESSIAPEVQTAALEGISPSLRKSSMDQLLNSLLEDPEREVTALSEAKLLPDFVPQLKSKLYNEAASHKPSSGLIALLLTALQDDVFVNLGAFQTISPGDLSLLVARLSSEGKMKGLDLSNMHKLTDEELYIILSATKTPLQILGLINCPKVTLDALQALGCDCDLHHSILYTRAIMDNRTRKEGRSWDCEPIHRLDFVNDTEDSIVQMVWVGMDKFSARKPELRRPDGTYLWERLTSDNEVPNFCSSRFDGGLKYRELTLVDVPLPLARLTSGLSHLLQWGSTATMNGMLDFSTAAAASFAMPASLPGGLNLAVAPPSTELYLRNTDYNTSRRVIAPEEPNLKPGQWALILVHECYDAFDRTEIEKGEDDDEPELKKRLRYAFVSPIGQGFKVVDVHGYLDYRLSRITAASVVSEGKKQHDSTLFQQVGQWWDNNFKASESVGFYDEPDIHDILRQVYHSPEDAVTYEPEAKRGGG